MREDDKWGECVFVGYTGQDLNVEVCTGIMLVCLSLRKRAERKRERRCDGQNNEQNTKC